MKPRILDLFAGCGGLTAGFVEAGFEPVGAVEFDLAAAATYAANFDPTTEHTFFGDITEFRDVPDCDVVIGGPPCQGFSGLGSQNAEDPRNKLWQEFARVVVEAQPKAFVIENVDRFQRSPEFDLLMTEVESGALRDFEVSVRVLPAADYGVPQRRKRTIVIGSRAGKPSMPETTHSDQLALGKLPWATVRDAISDLAPEPSVTSLPERSTRVFGEDLPGVFKAEEIHVGRNPKAISLARYDFIPPGGGRFDLPDELSMDCWRNKPTGTTDVMGRMRWDRPSLTIRTEFFKPEKGQYLHPQWDESDPKVRVNRAITHLEAARLQTFSDDFLWCGSKLQIARQIGNAVPPLLGEAIGRHVLRLIS